MKIKMRQLRQLFSEGAISRILKEEDDSSAHESGASGGSLDSQVDRYLGQYENDAKKTPGDDDMGASIDQMESLDWRDLVKGRLIIEAGQSDKNDEDPGDAAPGASAMMDTDTDKLGTDSLDVESFANDVVRLIENYDSLLEIRSTLIRRTIGFLQKNYDDDVVQAFQETMRDDHGMEAGTSAQDISAEKFTAPAADRANGSAAPGGGGAPPG